jgi:type 1 glutamine amidotransferase
MLMPQKALLVGGCPAPYHRLEPAAPPIRAALESLGLEVRVSGIYHPDGGDAFTGDYSALTSETLRDADLLVLYTTGRERHGADIQAIVEFVEGGRALVGIHNAADSFTDSAEFIGLLGGKFRTHPAQLDITTEVVDAAHPITQGVETFTLLDELYLFSDYDPARVHLLAQTRSYDDNGPVPIAWTREPGAGRVFYISLGHNPGTLADARWQAFFKNGVEWALRRR